MYIKQNNTQLIDKKNDELSIDTLSNDTLSNDTHDCLNRVQTQ